MAARTRRDPVCQIAAAIKRVPARSKLLALCGLRLELLGRVEGSKVTHVLVGEVRDHSGHDGILAFRLLACLGLEIRKLLAQVLRELSRELWIRRSRAVAIRGMTGYANLRRDLLSFTGVGSCRRLRHADPRPKGCDH